MKKALKFIILPAAILITAITACNKDNATSVDDAIDQTLYDAQERGGMGKYGCFELLFPVSIALPDSTTVSVNSYDELKQTLRDYFSSHGTNGHHGVRPFIRFVFPITVVNEDGEMITVENEQQLLHLRASCAGTFGNHTFHGHGQHGLSCFEIVFPVTIAFPDGTTASAADRQELHQLLRTWRQNNPNATERPHLAFPLTVKLTDDGSLVTVNSREELHDLKAGCE